MIYHRRSEALLGAPCVAWGAPAPHALRAVLESVARWAVVQDEHGSLLATAHAACLDVLLPHQVWFAADEPRGGPGANLESFEREDPATQPASSRRVMSCFPSRNGHACALPAAASADCRLPEV